MTTGNRNNDRSVNPWAAGLLGAVAAALGIAAYALTKKENRKAVNEKLTKLQDRFAQKSNEVKKQAASQVKELASQAKTAAENLEKKASGVANPKPKPNTSGSEGEA